ncbi:MAG: acyl carrier protein [Halobacteriovoraceae bacterium]|nr:acyl carrier protein [Halobacteriovoraceae bacterium]|tara:strand:+ start:2658 stop:2900 length:243 start_codon:yes stop_codon:yes gene_type:complete
MTAEEVKQVVLDIISDVAPDEEVSDINSAESLRDQLDLDSMDFLDIVMELRKRHSVEVPSEDYPRLATLDSCVEYLTPKM